MERKKILLVCKSFYPEISPRSFRATELAKEFSRVGHDVVVCFPTRGNDYTIFERNNNLKIKNLGKLNFNRIEIFGNSLQRFIRKSIRRSLMYLIEYPDIELMFKVAKILKYQKDYDLLISIAFPHPIHWGVARVLRKNKDITETWIADCGDPYMLSRLDTLPKPFYFKYLEKDFCKKCDFITVPVESAKSAYYPEFRNKIKVIPQGFALENIKLPVFKRLHPFPRFAYAGSFIPGKRDPRPLLDYLSSQHKYFKFFIYTKQPGLILNYKRQLNDKLEIKEFVPRDTLLKELVGMDFLVNIDNNVTEQVPSKLIDYAITGRPILNIKNDNDFSIVDEFLNGNYSRKLEIGDLQQYNIKNVANQFISLL